jgi:hypothetical protein
VRPSKIRKDAYRSPLSKYEASRRATIESWGANGHFREKLPQSGINGQRRGHWHPKGPPLFLRKDGFPKMCARAPDTNDSDFVQWQWCGGPHGGLIYRRRKAQSAAFVKRKWGARCGKGVR